MYIQFCGLSLVTLYCAQSWQLSAWHAYSNSPAPSKVHQTVKNSYVDLPQYSSKAIPAQWDHCISVYYYSLVASQLGAQQSQWVLASLLLWHKQASIQDSTFSFYFTKIYLCKLVNVLTAWQARWTTQCLPNFYKHCKNNLK